MATNKFPKTYHEGALNAAKPYENRAYNIYTESGAPLWQPGDSGIDFYTFKDEAGNDDSPETSYVLVVIKNQGEPESILDLSNVAISNPGNVPINPFSIVTNYSDVNVSASITTGTDGLHTIPYADYPNVFSIDDGTGNSTNVDYGAAATGFTALDPAPIGFVRLVTTGETIEGSNTNDDEPFNDFGSSSVLRYIPFYKPSDLMNSNNAIGNTATDYGSGTEPYPHYAAILIKCDPTEPMEIQHGEIMLNIFHSQYQQINISLVMTAYNVGNAAYEQGWLYKHGENVSLNYDPEQGSMDTGTWRYEQWNPHATVTPSTVSPGAINSAMSFSNIPYSATGSEAPTFDTSTTNNHNFFLPPKPKNLYWNNYNNFLQNDATQNTYADRLPCVRIWDDTSFTGGIQWHHFGDEAADFFGLKVDYGVLNSNSVYENENPSTTYIKVKTLNESGNTSLYQGPYKITNDTIEGPSGLMIEMNNLSSTLHTLSPNEYLYLVMNTGDGKQNSSLDNKTHRSYAGVPLFPNSMGRGTGNGDGAYAFRMNANVYPFYHKDYYVNSNINGPTQKEAIPILHGTYDYLTMVQKQIYRYTKAWSADNDGNFESGQGENARWAQHGYALGGSGGFNLNNSSNDPNGDLTFRARTHTNGNQNSQPLRIPGIHSYYKGNRLGMANMHGLHFDARNHVHEGDVDSNWDDAEGATQTITWSSTPHRGYSKVISDTGTASGGWKSVKKHMHLRDIVRIPYLTALSGPNPQDDDFHESTVHPSVTWTVFNPDYWDNTETNMNPYADNFPWSDESSVWDTDSETWYDGGNTKNGAPNRIIKKENLLSQYVHYGTSNTRCGFVPAGFHRCVTGGAENIAEVLSPQIGPDSSYNSDSSVETNNPAIFAEDSGNWETNFTIRGFNVKQKTIKLKTKASGLPSNDGAFATGYNIPESPTVDYHRYYNFNNGAISSYGNPPTDPNTPSWFTGLSGAPGGNYESQALDDRVYHTGDAIGRFYVATRFTINQNAAVNYAKTTNAQGGGNLDTSITHSSNTLEFTLWAYFWPRYQRGITSLMTGTLGEAQGHMKTVDNLYITEWSCRTNEAVTGMTGVSEGAEVTDEMIETFAQPKSMTTSPTDTYSFVPQYSSWYEFKIASKVTTKSAYWKKLPFNGRAMLKHQRYFTHDVETAQKISISGLETANDAYGIIPGPRFPGRFPDETSGEWEWAWQNDYAIYEGTTTYNENSNTYDCFIPVNVGVLGRSSDYGIQLVNISLENENLKPSGKPTETDGEYEIPRNRPHQQGVMFGNPLYRWQRHQSVSGSGNSEIFRGGHLKADTLTSSSYWSIQSGGPASATPEPHQRMTRNDADTGDEMRFIHHAAISDTNINPQVGMETHEMHPIVRTAPLSNITVKNVGTISATTQDINLLNANIVTIKNNVAVSNAFLNQDLRRAKDAGIRVGQKVYHVDSISGAKLTGTTEGTSNFNCIPNGATVLAINDNVVTISANTLNTSDVTLGTNTIRFDYPQPNYASWCMSRGTRQSWQSHGVRAMERSGVAYQKYSPYFIMPFSNIEENNFQGNGQSKFIWWRYGGTTVTQGQFPNNYDYVVPAWDATGSDWKCMIGGFNSMPAGMIHPTPDSAQQISVVGTSDNFDYVFKENTLWWCWFNFGLMNGITNAEQQGAASRDNYYPIWYQDIVWTNAYSQYTSISGCDLEDLAFSKLGPHGRYADGCPHICLQIDKEKAVANQIEYGVFYNTVRIRYMLNNKLENFGLDNERIGPRYFNEFKGTGFISEFGNNSGDLDDNMVNYAEGGAVNANVYEDVFLVKVIFDASVPALVVSDLEGDAQANNTAIDFGILNSN